MMRTAVIQVVTQRGSQVRRIANGNRRLRGFAGIVERALLGATMNFILFVAEWQLNRMKARRDADGTADGRSSEVERR